MSTQVAEGPGPWAEPPDPHVRVAERDHGQVAAADAGWWDGGATGRDRGGSSRL